MANSVDSDQTAPKEHSDLSLHCLLKQICPNIQGIHANCFCRFYLYVIVIVSAQFLLQIMIPTGLFTINKKRRCSCFICTGLRYDLFISFFPQLADLLRKILFHKGLTIHTKGREELSSLTATVTLRINAIFFYLLVINVSHL